LLDWPQSLPDGTTIHRPELQKLLSLIDDSEFSITALLGAAGSGKTALLAAFAHSLRTREIPFLAIIAITLHRLGPQTRQAGLELFEKLLTINAYTARETLDQIDNRFRENAPTARPRLPRRTRRPSRRVRRAARA